MTGAEHSIEAHVRLDVSSVPPQGAYLAKRCPVVAQNDVLVRAEKVQPDAFTRRLFAHGNDFEAHVFKELASLGALLIDEPDEAERIGLTVQAMRERVPAILGGQLPTDLANKRAGKPDALVAAASGGYRAVDIKSHRATQKARTAFPGWVCTLKDLRFESHEVSSHLYARKHQGDLLQLAHYQRLLEGCGQSATDGRFGAVIGTEEVAVWYDLDNQAWATPSSNGLMKRRSTMERYDFEFGFRLDVIATALRSLKDPKVKPLVQPVRIPECDRCAWHDVCLAELSKDDGDISLLPGIGFNQWRQHSNRGVKDRAQLAALQPSDPRYEDWSMDGLQDHIDEARAWMSPEPFHLRRGVSRLDMPSGDIEIDIDLESAEQGVYLWGALRSEHGAADEGAFSSFANWEPLTPETEIETFLSFWSWLSDQLAVAASAGLSLKVFHYADIERYQMKRLASLGGVADEVSAFLASGNCVDLYKLATKKLITGTALGLKVVAPLAGFQWQVEDPGGALSMLKYELAVSSKDPREAAEARSWLLDYNRNDVEATLAIRECLIQNPPKPLQ